MVQPVSKQATAATLEQLVQAQAAAAHRQMALEASAQTEAWVARD